MDDELKGELNTERGRSRQRAGRLSCLGDAQAVVGELLIASLVVLIETEEAERAYGRVLMTVGVSSQADQASPPPELVQPRMG